ncbi:MAG: hypothetical protein V3R78_09800 [Thermodesulfobacteriota bacterium]
MKQRRFIRKLQKSARRVLVVFLAIIFTLTVNIIVSESGRPRAAHRGGQGSIRHQGEAREHPQKNERRTSKRRHARRHHRGSIHNYEVYDDDDEYYDDYCDDYGDDCYYDDYYDDCICDD